MNNTSKIFEKHFGKSTIAVGLQHPNMISFFGELAQDCLKEDYEKQCKWYSKNSPLSFHDVPKRWIDWKNGKYVEYEFTGKFQKVMLGDFNKRIAARNRDKCFAYKAEYKDREGNKFPLLGLYRSVPKELVSNC